MKLLRYALPVFLILILAGCYHATLTTDRTPSTVVYEEAFATGWVYGLVPPKTVDLVEKCPSGVAKVETQLSFLNQLVAALTGGIYTPMSIRVTCAMEGSASLDTGFPSADTDLEGLNRDDLVSELEAAADRAVESGEPVLVRLR